jgi:pimeloyl-ACP methyl ester carboxylesterase
VEAKVRTDTYFTGYPTNRPRRGRRQGIDGEKELRCDSLFAMFLGLVLAVASAIPQPCTSATLDCTEWIKLAGQPSRILVYRTHRLDTRNEHITRAFVFVHGIFRDADNHFRTALAAAFLANALDDTIIVAPRFASNSSTHGNEGGDCRDTLAPDEANWVCEVQRPDAWRSGGAPMGDGKLSSFDFMDEILRRLARKESFPNLKTIVVAGHSAGGQFVIRYEMLNQVHDTLGVPVSYLVANPSSYAYVDGQRPTTTAFPATASVSPPGLFVSPPSSPPPSFAPFADAKNCTGYKTWPYGLEGRTGYSASLTDEQITQQLVARPVTYLLGEADVLPLGIFDTSCPAMAQGPTRLARGFAFHKYVDENLHGHHRIVVVPFCSHSQRCMFTSEVALPLMFPK